MPDFFKKPIHLVYHCSVYKSYKITLNHNVLEFFSLLLWYQNCILYTYKSVIYCELVLILYLQFA